MIHIELSVEPHHKEVRWIDIDNFVRDPETPPHLIFKKEFTTIEEATGFVRTLGLFTDDEKEAIETIESSDQYYVGVELELREVTGKLYINACLAIEGEPE